MKGQKFRCLDKKGTTGIITLINPPENRIEEPEFIRREQLYEALQDKDLKGILVRGTGRHFSAGADLGKLKQLAQDEQLLSERMTAGKNLISMIESSEIPVVAMISGVCFGAGLEIALACHIRICSENALFAFPEVNYGILPGLGGTVMLPKLIGAGRSAEIILSGDIVDTQKALDYRLADYVVPNSELETFSMNYIEKMTSDRDVEVIRSVMKSIHNALTLPFEKALEEETKLFCSLALRNLQDQ
jgi:enoyl-CoA hydratase/carnithine racemase